MLLLLLLPLLMRAFEKQNRDEQCVGNIIVVRPSI